MKVKVISGDVKDTAADILVLGLFEGVKRVSGTAKRVDELLGGSISRALKRKEITGKFGDHMIFPTEGKIAPERVVVIGLGSKDALSLDRMRHLSLYPVKVAKKLKKQHIATSLIGMEGSDYSEREAVRFLTLGYLLSNYTYDRFKGEKSHKVSRLTILVHQGSMMGELKSGVFEAEGIASGVNFARDLVNAPPADLRPQDLAREAEKLSGERVKVRVYREGEIRKLGMRGLYAVGMGSSSPPRLIVASYRGGGGKEKPFAVVGKGVTFDTGGISLKKWDGMEKMKYDMAGAAAALGIIKAISALKLRKNVVAVVPVAENMPSGTAFRPGDVIRMMSGKTVEVLTTDAEGRLILGDAIHFAKVKLGARAIIDIATLTGACVVALGSIPIGMVGNDRDLLEKCKGASVTSGERVWELPLYEEYGEQIESLIADIKNLGGPEGGAITAGYFLKHFAGDTPWVHLDIAGVAWREKERMGYLPGPTGAGIRLITELLMEYPGR